MGINICPVQLSSAGCLDLDSFTVQKQSDGLENTPKYAFPDHQNEKFSGEGAICTETAA